MRRLPLWDCTNTARCSYYLAVETHTTVTGGAPLEPCGALGSEQRRYKADGRRRPPASQHAGGGLAYVWPIRRQGGRRKARAHCSCAKSH